jgi:uncharacterized small protein (DUF1192 family)
VADSLVSRKLTAGTAVLLLCICFLLTRILNEDEVARVQAEVQSLEREKDSIQAIVATNVAAQEVLQLTRESKDAEAAALRDHVDRLERERHASALTVRRIRKTSALQARLDSTFPEMARSNWGLTTIPYEPGDTLGLEYFVIPAWFTETFLIDHENAESWREQKDKLLTVDSLRVQVATLQDSIARLHASNTFALQTGYDNAASEYREMSTRYMTELRKPRLSLGSTVGLCLGAAGAGVVIGTLVR